MFIACTLQRLHPLRSIGTRSFLRPQVSLRHHRVLSMAAAVQDPSWDASAASAAIPSPALPLVIVGSGPAAHTAAIYAARASLAPVLYEGWMAGGVAAGGQLTTTTDVENFPGFPAGIGGYELTEKFAEQSKRFGTVVIPKTIARVDFSARPFKLWVEDSDTDAPVLAHAVILATGATARKLDVPGADTYWMKGVSACAVCDGALPVFRKKPLAVIGGGDTACEEALHLSKTASHVTLIHRRDALRASRIMADRVRATPNITILYNHVVTEVRGLGSSMNALGLRNIVDGVESELLVRGMFLAIGHTPATAFLGNQVALDEDGYIKTTPDMRTSVEGVFAAGDVQDRKYRQAITAAGSGCVAALEAERWLAMQELH